MKKSLQLPPVLLFVVSLCFTAQAQVQEWQAIQSFPDSRSGAVSFLIGDTAYVGTGSNGSNYLKSFYKYNSEDGNWRSINDFPGAARKNAVTFVADGKAYVGTGTDGTTQLKDFYEYNPTTGNWTAIADIPGEIRNQASSFSINNKGYVGLGGNDTGSLNDFYEFEPSTGNWNPITGLPTDDARSKAVGFSANGKGYIAGGYDGSFTYSGLLSYDPTSDSWTEEIFADVKLSSLQQNTDFIDDEGLVHILKAGFTNEHVIIDLSDNSLKYGDFYFDDERNRGVAFYLNGEAYAGIGLIYDEFGNGVEKNDFRKLVTIYPPEALTNLRKSTQSDLIISWDYNSDNVDGYIVYLSERDNQSYEVKDSTTLNYFEFDTLKQGVRNYIKVAAYNKGGAAESQEIDYIPLYNSGKLVTPTLKEVTENQNDSTEINMFLQFINYDQAGTVKVEMSKDGVNFESQFTQSVRKLDTAFASYEPLFEKNSDNLYYRIKLVAEGREDSDYSNVVVFDTKELQPLAPQVKYSVEQRYLSYGNYDFEYFIAFSKYNHVDSITLQAIQKDTIKFEKVIKYNFGENAARFVLEPNDTINLLAINSNVFGSDTFNVKIVAPAFNKPSFGEYVESNTEAIQFSIYTNVDLFKGYTIIERANEENEFVPIDSIRPTGIYNSGSIPLYFIDKTVEPNKEYSYRLVNRKGKLQSLYSYEIKQIKSTKTPSWKVYKETPFKMVIDSLENEGITNIDYFDNKVFFVSAKTNKAYYFNLDTDQLIKMEDIPLSMEYYHNAEFTEIEFVGNKLYCFTPLTDRDQSMKTVFIYDFLDDTWSRYELENIDRTVGYSVKLTDQSILLSYGSGNLAIFNTDNNTLDFKEVKTASSITYIDVSPDSITFFDYDKRVYRSDKNLTNINPKQASEQKLLKSLIAKHKDKLFKVGNSRVSEIELGGAIKIGYMENFPFSEVRKSFVFSYNDTLVYFNGLYTNAINNFYYRDTDAPGTLVGLRLDTVAYEYTKVSWVDSPDETAYQVELLNDNDEVLYSERLSENSTSYIFNGLVPNEFFQIVVTPLNNDLEGASERRRFRARSATPSVPINIKLEQSSNDSLQLSWEIAEFSPKVDSIIVGNITKTVKSTGDFQSIYLKVRNENDSIRQFIRAKNQWDISWDGSSNKILTRLYSPTITEVAYFEKEGKYQIVINDSSEFETHFKLFRKTKEQEEFELLEVIDGNQPSEFTFDDFIEELSITYEYYIQSYLAENDSVLNSSFPSNIATTENAVLSNSPLKSDELSIFPNPVNGYIYISSELNIQLKQIEVLSLEGRKIKTFEASETINVSELEKGIYLLKIKAKSGEVTKRFIKE